MQRAACLLVLAACFEPSPPAGAPCGDGEVCPAGLVCTRGTCETSEGSNDPSDEDDDDDGVPDVADNCPEDANPSQADEDLDAIGDLCDPCPPFVGDDDPDGDGVATACDPNPQTPGDRIVAFEGFSAPLSTTWTSTGAFMVASGEAVALAGENQSALLTMASPQVERVEVRAAALAGEITATGTNLGAINLVERLASGTEKGVACQLAGLEDGSEQQLRIFDLDAGAIVNTAQHAFVAGLEVELRMRRDGTNYLCRATSPLLEIAGSSAYRPPAAQIGLRVRSVFAAFHWVMVVTSP